MALFGNFDNGYTKTGNGGLTSVSKTLSFVPFVRSWRVFQFLNKIPVIGPLFGNTIVGALGFLDTGIEAAGWLLRGKFGSAATVAIAGTVSTAVDILPSPVFWWLNAGSGITTGKTLGTHARALTESAIGGVTGALGMKPQVLASYPAGIGSLSRSMAPAGPGKFVTQVADSRGEDPNAAYARLQSGQSDHLAALEAAQTQQNYANR